MIGDLLLITSRFRRVLVRATVIEGATKDKVRLILHGETDEQSRLSLRYLLKSLGASL